MFTFVVTFIGFTLLALTLVGVWAVIENFRR